MLVDSNFSVSVFVMDVRPKPSTRKIVEERDERGVCLLCEKPAVRRGLCDCHYARFRMAKLDVAREKRAEFEAQQIREGRVLPSRQGQSRDFVNEFRQH